MNECERVAMCGSLSLHVQVQCNVCVCLAEEARCVRPNTSTSPNVTAFVQGPNGQYFVPGM